MEVGEERTLNKPVITTSCFSTCASDEGDRLTDCLVQVAKRRKAYETRGVAEGGEGRGGRI